MTWAPIIVGVDGSAESVGAAELGARIAAAAGTTCYLVHATPDYLAQASLPELEAGSELRRAALDHARTLIASTLDGAVPKRVLDTLDVRLGRAPLVLSRAAAERGAGLLVLGGKHPRGLARLFGSTITHVVRASDLPVLATEGGARRIDRVLVAVDLSHAAKPTIVAGERLARLFGATLRVLHVLESIPVVPGFAPSLHDDDYYRAAERALDTAIWPLIGTPGVHTAIRRGRAAAAIVGEATEWRADLVVVGAHGKGWVDRLLIGSTSERLLSLLPTSVLVVPIGKPADDETPLTAGCSSSGTGA